MAEIQDFSETDEAALMALSTDEVELMVDEHSAPPADLTGPKPDPRDSGGAQDPTTGGRRDGSSAGSSSYTGGDGDLSPPDAATVLRYRQCCEERRRLWSRPPRPRPGEWHPPDVLATFGVDPVTEPAAALLDAVLTGDDSRFDTVMSGLESSAEQGCCTAIFVAVDTAPPSPPRMRRVAKNLMGSCPSLSTKGKSSRNLDFQPATRPQRPLRDRAAAQQDEVLAAAAEEASEQLYDRLRRHSYLRRACSPLSAAAALGHGHMVERLLVAGAQPDPDGARALVEQGACWVSPLAAAALWGHVKIVHRLLPERHSGRINRSRKAAASRHTAADPSALSVLDGVSFPPLLLAPSWETAQALLDAGAKPELLPPAATASQQRPPAVGLLLAMIQRLAADDARLVATCTKEQPQQWQCFKPDGSEADLEALWRGCWLLHAADPRLAELWVQLGGQAVATAAELFQDMLYDMHATDASEPIKATLLEAAAAMQLAVDVSPLVVQRCLHLAAKPGAPAVHPEIAALLCRVVLVNQQADSHLMHDCLALLARGIRDAPPPVINFEDRESQQRMLLMDLPTSESGCLRLATLLAVTGLGWSTADDKQLPGGHLTVETPCPKPPPALLPGSEAAVSAAAIARIKSLDELGDVASKPEQHQGLPSTEFGSALVDPLNPGSVTLLTELWIAVTQPVIYKEWTRRHYGIVTPLIRGCLARRSWEPEPLTLGAYLAARLKPALWAAAAMVFQGWTGVGALCGATYVLGCAAVILVLLVSHTLTSLFMDDEDLPPPQLYTAVARRVLLPGVTSSLLLDSFPTLLEHMLSSRRASVQTWASPAVAAVVMSHWSCFTQHVAFQMLLLRLAFTVVFIVYALSLVDAGDATTADGSTSHPCPSAYQHRLMVALAWMTAEYVVIEVQQICASGVISWLRQPWNLFDAAETGLMAATLGLHWFCGASLDLLRGLSQVLVLVLFWRLMQHASTSRGLGSFVRMVLLVSYDLRLFFVFLGMVYVGFGVALMVVAPNWGLTTESGEPVGRAKAVFVRLYSMLYGSDFGMDVLLDPVPQSCDGE
ncbi:hypothetical protein HYH03_017224 [Edaphochlamys debaryana]|uniref:Ion transport domain-containing protein n=1 Tax=Edaphochlamys debaryana TaxID=47281 RepID=A0A835XG02_9CHLO|nr:hypothetical protein HYH03_017224 [Edaphochlamys debaryana]|eukprot:KAG2483902.1 hypothetical protein HYH03_017224 [Edaphochlamys debaryana]